MAVANRAQAMAVSSLGSRPEVHFCERSRLLVVPCLFTGRYSGGQLCASVVFQAAPLIQESSQEELDLQTQRPQFLEDSQDQSRRSYR